MRFGPLIVMAFVSSNLLFAQCSQKKYFYEEDRCFTQGPALSKEEVNAILQTDEGKDWSEDASPSELARAQQLLRGQIIHLHDKDQRDMLVRGTFPLSGGDNTWFWIITEADKHPRAFFVQGNSVTISRQRHNDYYDIRTDWDVAAQGETSFYRYERGDYRLAYSTPHSRRH